jgi:hypothetical protein
LKARVGLICAVVALVACGNDDAPTTASLLDIPDTVAIGEMPEPPSDVATLPTPPPPPTTTPTSTSTTAADGASGDVAEGALGESVQGRRILLIGDAILASAAPRNDGLLCDALALFGWQAEIDAEPGRDVDFAFEVLDARLEVEGELDWDAVALSFGSRVDGRDQAELAAFTEDLEAVIDRVAPRPTILFTLVEVDDSMAAVNEVIRSRSDAHPNVIVVDFADAGDDGVEVVDATGRALTDDGMKRFSVRTAAAVGKAPGDSQGECLPSEFGDDSNT